MLGDILSIIVFMTAAVILYSTIKRASIVGPRHQFDTWLGKEINNPKIWPTVFNRVLPVYKTYLILSLLSGTLAIIIIISLADNEIRKWIPFPIAAINICYIFLAILYVRKVTDQEVQQLTE